MQMQIREIHLILWIAHLEMIVDCQLAGDIMIMKVSKNATIVISNVITKWMVLKY